MILTSLLIRGATFLVLRQGAKRVIAPDSDKSSPRKITAHHGDPDLIEGQVGSVRSLKDQGSLLPEPARNGSATSLLSPSASTPALLPVAAQAEAEARPPIELAPPLELATLLGNLRISDSALDLVDGNLRSAARSESSGKDKFDFERCQPYSEQRRLRQSTNRGVFEVMEVDPREFDSHQFQQVWQS